MSTQSSRFHTISPRTDLEEKTHTNPKNHNWYLSVNYFLAALSVACRNHNAWSSHSFQLSNIWGAPVDRIHFVIFHLCFSLSIISISQRHVIMWLFSVLIGCLFVFKSPVCRRSCLCHFFNWRELLCESVFAMGPNLKYYSHSVSHSEADGHRCCRHRLKKCSSLSDFVVYFSYFIFGSKWPRVPSPYRLHTN